MFQTRIRYKLEDLSIPIIVDSAANLVMDWYQALVNSPSNISDNEIVKAFSRRSHNNSFYNFKGFLQTHLQPVLYQNSQRYIRPYFMTDYDNVVDPNQEVRFVQTRIADYIQKWVISNASKLYIMYKTSLDPQIIGSYSYDEGDNENLTYAVDFDEEGGLDNKANSKTKNNSKTIFGREKTKSWSNTQHNKLFRQLVNEIVETVTYYSFKDLGMAW